MNRSATTVDSRISPAGAGAAQGVTPPPGPAQVSAGTLVQPPTGSSPPPATVADEVPRAERDDDAVHYWTRRMLTAPKPAEDVPRRLRNSGQHPEWTDYATTISDLRIAVSLASGTPIEYVDRNGYTTLDYLYRQRAAATRLGISVAEYRRRMADDS